MLFAQLIFTTSPLKAEEVGSSERLVSFCSNTQPQLQKSSLNLVIVRVIQNTQVCSVGKVQNFGTLEQICTLTTVR